MKRIALGFVIGLACSSGLGLAQLPGLVPTVPANGVIGVERGTSISLVCTLAGGPLPSFALTVTPNVMVYPAQGIIGATAHCASIPSTGTRR